METTIPLDVDLLAERCGIEIYEDGFGSFLGLWFQNGGQQGIALNDNQIPRRRRFTLAHELGHACMPWHQKAAGLMCIDDDLSEADVDRELEREANAFAGELLAPRKLVSPLLATGPLSMRKAEEIANRFEISLTSATRRVVEHGKQAAAVVLCEGGRIRWSVRRHGFPYGLPGRGERIPAGTIAREVHNGRPDCLDPRRVERLAWLPESDGPFSVMESAIGLRALDQVVALLWIPDIEVGEDDEAD
jgi:hypothetical protein